MGPPMAFVDRGDFTGLSFIWRSNGIRRAPSKDTCLESLKRSSVRLNVGTDTLYACLKTPQSSACNASLPRVPVPSRAACWHATVERSRALFKYRWYLWNVAAAINNRSLDVPFQECLFFTSSGYRVATAARSTRQARPDLGALHAGDCGICVLQGQ